MGSVSVSAHSGDIGVTALHTAITPLLIRTMLPTVTTEGTALTTTRTTPTIPRTTKPTLAALCRIRKGVARTAAIIVTRKRARMKITAGEHH